MSDEAKREGKEDFFDLDLTASVSDLALQTIRQTGNRSQNFDSTTAKVKWAQTHSTWQKMREEDYRFAEAG